MSLNIFELATDVRTVSCSLYEGSGDCTTNTSSYSDVQAQWRPDLGMYPCPPCKGRGERIETYCLACLEPVSSCGCNDVEIEQFLLGVYLGAA